LRGIPIVFEFSKLKASLMKAESQLYFQKSQELKTEVELFKVISLSQKLKPNHSAAKRWL